MVEDAKELTPEEKEELFKTGKSAGKWLAGSTGAAGAAGLFVSHKLKKDPKFLKYIEKNYPHIIQERTPQLLKATGAVGVPTGIALVGYSSHKLKKLKKEQEEKEKNKKDHDSSKK